MSGGYGDYAFEYLEKGWKPLPLPESEKKFPPTGFTGFSGADPSYADVYSWTEERPTGNVALHLTGGVIGIDVDDYNNKTGGACLNEAIRRWGPLPATWISTSRTDKVSGIRMFRAPDIEYVSIISFPDQKVGNIEIIQRKHRYTVAFPSTHPDTGMTYQWLDSQWNECEIPSVAELPELPEAWVEGLRDKGATEVTTDVDGADIIAHLPDGPMSDEVRKALAQARKDIDCAPDSRHDMALKNILRLFRLAERGEIGVKEALALYADDFVRAIRDRASRDEAMDEYRRMLVNKRGHNLIASSPSVDTEELFAGGSKTVAPVPEFVELDSFWDWEAQARKEEQQPVVDMVAEQLEAEVLGFFDIEPDEPSSATTDDRTDIPFIERLKTVRGLRTVKPAAPLIDGLLYKNTLAQISGAPGSYKSFLTLGMAMAVASPGMKKYLGFDVVEHGRVIYVAAEGLTGMRVRAEAWCQEYGVDPEAVRIEFFPDAFDISLYSHVEQVLEMVGDRQPLLLVIDTRARVTGTLDENSATEQGTAIENFERIRRSTDNGVTILAVHHSSKSGASGRGSNAWDGAVWTELRSESKAQFTMRVHCEKHKDAESGCDHEFVMKKVVVDLPTMPEFFDEKYRTTLVTKPVDYAEKRKEESNAITSVADVIALAGAEGMLRADAVAQIKDLLGKPTTTAKRWLWNAEEKGSIRKIVHQGRPDRFVKAPEVLATDLQE